MMRKVRVQASITRVDDTREPIFSVAIPGLPFKLGWDLGLPSLVRQTEKVVAREWAVPSFRKYVLYGVLL